MRRRGGRPVSLLARRDACRLILPHWHRRGRRRAVPGGVLVRGRGSAGGAVHRRDRLRVRGGRHDGRWHRVPRRIRVYWWIAARGNVQRRGCVVPGRLQRSRRRAVCDGVFWHCDGCEPIPQRRLRGRLPLQSGQLLPCGVRYGVGGAVPCGVRVQQHGRPRRVQLGGVFLPERDVHGGAAPVRGRVLWGRIGVRHRVVRGALHRATRDVLCTGVHEPCWRLVPARVRVRRRIRHRGCVRVGGGLVSAGIQ